MALLGSYTPRKCGIATFTKDLRDALSIELSPGTTRVLAMDDGAESYDYPSEVHFEIPQHKQSAYRPAAEMLNINEVDVCCIQHEYGIYGGNDGSHVLDFARDLRMPIITTLHTVLPDPSPGQRTVLREIIRVSDRVVVMSQCAEQILTSTYGARSNRITHIPHGIPDVPFVDSNFYKDQFDVEGRKVILTFGLLGPGKGIEVAIKAMAKVVEKHPDAVYIILGATHPHVLRREGNAYRNSLVRLVEDLGLENNILFHNRYVSLAELIRYIGVADIYVTPYPNAQQITSGTLAYALGAGKPVVSTPYLYAKEMLADGRGRFFDFGSSDGLAEQVIDLFDNETERHAIRKRAYVHGRPMIWKNVARSYIALARQVIDERDKFPKLVRFQRAKAIDLEATPELNLAHLRRLTDGVGILQHAIYATPDRNHGYCIDDNSRALIASLSAFDLTKDESIVPLVDRYMSFLHYGFNEGQKRFRNFMTYDRRWLDDVGSEDVHGRTIWALGSAVRRSPSSALTALAVRLIQPAVETVEQFTSPRAWAFALIGIDEYLQTFSGDTLVRRVRNELAQRLHKRFIENRDPNWPWCEDVLTYDNAKLPHALIVAGDALDDAAMRQQGFASLQWLVEQQLVGGRVSLIGNHGWLDRKGHRARFDQQPIEAMATIEACAAAWRITREDAWYERARKFLDWFIGNNDTGSTLYDHQTGGCRDGLNAAGPNQNQGAESTLAWLISLLTIMDLNRLRTLDDAVDPRGPLEDPQISSSPVATGG